MEECLQKLENRIFGKTEYVDRQIDEIKYLSRDAQNLQATNIKMAEQYHQPAI